MSTTCNTKEILKRRQFVSTARRSPFWAAVNAGSLLLCLIDFIYSFISPIFYLRILQNVFVFIEFILIVIFCTNIIYNLYLYVWFKKLMQPIELSSKECVLYGIDPKEVGFKLRDDSASGKTSPDAKISKSGPSPKFELSTSSIIDKHQSLDSTALSTRLFDTSQESISHSWSFTRPNVSPHRMNQSVRESPNRSFNNSGTDLRLRKSSSMLPKLGSPRTSAVISSEEDLKRYLAEQNERAEQMHELIQGQKHFSSMDDENHSGSMHHHRVYYGSPKRDHPHHVGSPLSPKNQFVSPLARSPVHHSESNLSPYTTANLAHTSPHSPPGSGHVDPRNLHHRSPDSVSPTYLPYQPAIKVSVLPSSPNEKSESLNSSTRALEKVLHKLDVDDARLNQMVENIRKWISQTILVRLVAEIDSINKAITEKGYIDSLIGETSIKQLKQLVTNKKSEFPTLEQVCAFLDINVRGIENNIPFQHYLVRRIKDLAKGGCMIEFLWDGGGSYNYKHWKDDMITDSEIILHVFCVYMDSRLLFNPTIPEGKPFTSQHFKSNNGAKPKSDTYIEQEKSYPPHYSLVLKSEPFELPQGRNNLFYALLIFLHHIKVKNFGLLGRINLGSSGLNISWVIDK